MITIKPQNMDIKEERTYTGLPSLGYFILVSIFQKRLYMMIISIRLLAYKLIYVMGESSLLSPAEGGL